MFDINSIGTRGAYAGIGSRSINKETAQKQVFIAFVLALHGLKLRSGGAGGSDTAFEFGAKLAYDFLVSRYPDSFTGGQYDRVMEIFLPWPSFNYRNAQSPGYTSNIPHEAFNLAKLHHPQKEGLQGSTLKFMARNCMQALGSDLGDPSRFILCYTPDGVNEGNKTTNKTGGTGQAIRVASSQSINVYNLNNADQDSFTFNWINTRSEELGQFFEIDLKKYVDDAYQAYNGNMNVVIGDLVQMANSGEIDVLVHGCNAHCRMKSGIAGAITKTFPEATAADQQTKTGDRSKLGSYTYATVERNGKLVTIVNAYTQFNYGYDGKLYADYNAIDKVFKKIKADFSGKLIAYPLIGSGLASGDWVTISNSINGALDGERHVLVKLPN